MDKKYILLLLLLLALIVFSILFYRSHDLKRTYEAEVLKEINCDRVPENPIINETDLLHLPKPVQTYLRYVGVIGTEKVRNFKITFEGQMKMDPKKDWISVKTEQLNFVANPTRIFYIEGNMSGIPIIGLDSYKNGKGNMLIKLAGKEVAYNRKGL